MNVIFLDSGPLGLVAQRPGLAVADACRSWLEDHVQRGAIIVVPEISDYEVRRELLRLRNLAACARLDAICSAGANRYLPLSTPAMKLAAEYWARSRQQGLPTADPKELDADVILAAQAATAGYPAPATVIATTNPGHLNRFANAKIWQTI